MQTFFEGVNYFNAGFKLIFKPGIRRFIIIPFIINIIFFILLFFLMRHYLVKFNALVANYLPAWLQWLDILIWILFVTAFFLLFIYLFVTVANIISAPFNSFLSEKVAFYLTNRSLAQRTLKEIMFDLPAILGRQFAIIFYYLPRACFILLLFLIPFFHPLAAIIWFLFNAWYMALTYIDYPTDNYHIPLKDVKLWLRENRGLTLGFGFAVLIVAMIPILNFFVIPAAVAAATKLWIEKH